MRYFKFLKKFFEKVKYEIGNLIDVVEFKKVFEKVKGCFGKKDVVKFFFGFDIDFFFGG